MQNMLVILATILTGNFLVCNIICNNREIYDLFLCKVMWNDPEFITNVAYHKSELIETNRLIHAESLENFTKMINLKPLKLERKD